MTVSRQFHAVGFRANVTDGNVKQNFAARDFLAKRLLGALAQQAQFKLAHGPFESEQQAVVEHTGIVNAIGINHQGVGQNTQVNQMMPVAVVARQTRRFQRQNRTRLAIADRRQQTSESRSFLCSCAGHAHIFIDDLDVSKPQLPRSGL